MAESSGRRRQGGGAAAKYQSLKSEAAALGEKVLAQLLEAHTFELEEQYFLSRPGSTMVDYTPSNAMATAIGNISQRKLDYERQGQGAAGGMFASPRPAALIQPACPPAPTVHLLGF